MNNRTNYENRYAGDAYYWGTEPGTFLDELIRLCPPAPGKTVLDIGCGEGKDAVYMAEQGYAVTAFDLSENGIRKTLRLAQEKNVTVHAYTDDINTFAVSGQFDIVYSTGTVQYLFDENKKAFLKSSAVSQKRAALCISMCLWRSLFSDSRRTGIKKKKCGGRASCSHSLQTGRSNGSTR